MILPDPLYGPGGVASDLGPLLAAVALVLFSVALAIALVPLPTRLKEASR